MERVDNIVAERVSLMLAFGFEILTGIGFSDFECKRTKFHFSPDWTNYRWCMGHHGLVPDHDQVKPLTRRAANHARGESHLKAIASEDLLTYR